MSNILPCSWTERSVIADDGGSWSFVDICHVVSASGQMGRSLCSLLCLWSGAGPGDTGTEEVETDNDSLHTPDHHTDYILDHTPVDSDFPTWESTIIGKNLQRLISVTCLD